MVETNDIMQKGKVITDRSILLSIIRIATKETAGVASVVSPFSQKIKNIVTNNSSEGVSISSDKKGRIVIDVYVVLYYNYNVSEVAYKIQKNIKNSIATMVDLDVKDVNVHVVDVEISDKND